MADVCGNWPDNMLDNSSDQNSIKICREYRTRSSSKRNHFPASRSLRRMSSCLVLLQACYVVKFGGWHATTCIHMIGHGMRNIFSGHNYIKPQCILFYTQIQCKNELMAHPVSGDGPHVERCTACDKWMKIMRDDDQKGGGGKIQGYDVKYCYI